MSRKIEHNTLTVLSANANSLKNKMLSFNFNLEQLKPDVVVIQETKLKRKNQINVKGYRTFPTIRGDSGGGVLISCLISLDPVLIFEGDEESEIIVVQIKLNDKQIRIIGGYGPQECAPVVVRETYRTTMEEQVVRAYLAGNSVIIAEDSNAKLGSQWIKGDPHPISDNGKLLGGMIERQDLCLINSSNKCSGGPITRRRIVNEHEEESCIDFVMTSPDLSKYLSKATIDSQQLYALTKYTTTKGMPSVKRSDHYTIIVKFDLKWQEDRPPREEVFKLRDLEGLQKFSEITTNSNSLLNCVQQHGHLDEVCERCYKEFHKLMHQCFNKVTITNVPPKKTVDYELYQSMVEMNILKSMDLSQDNMNKAVIDAEVRRYEAIIAEIQGTKCKKLIHEERKNLRIGETFNPNMAWSLKKKLFPKYAESPFAIYNKNEQLVTDSKGILEVMKEEFAYRLRNRPIDNEYTELKEVKEYLCMLRLEITRNSDYVPWSMTQLKVAISKLKNGKCKDPHGHINELYRSLGIKGIEALLELLNRIKKEIIVPTSLRLSNVSTIYKGKGSKRDVLNLRGIFKLPIIRNILDRLIYKQEQETVNDSMGQFQVGNHTLRSIRDHTLIVHAIVNDAITNNIEIDILFTDIKQCFDSIWLEEAINDLYDSGIRSRNLNLLYEGNKSTDMLVETKFGRSDRVCLKKVVMQGSVTGGMLCSNQLSKLCNNFFKSGTVYMYSNTVAIPSLAMVDDLVAIALCNSVAGMKSNVKTDEFIKSKKLEGQVGEGKCQWVHVGKAQCPASYVINSANITQSKAYKYLGDHVSDGFDCLYHKRFEKSQGYVATCLAMCTEISLGYQMYSTAKLLHQASFLNGTMVHMET